MRYMNIRYKVLLIIFILIVIVVVFAAISKPGQPVVVTDFKNTSYEVGGVTVALVDGTASSDIPDSVSKTVTRYFGNNALGDLNGDGVDDVAFILTQTSGGSGTFYYVVAALKTDTGYQGTNAVLLGDRIAPQTTEIHDGEVIVNYADRKPDEAMTVDPSVGVSKYLQVIDGLLEEIVKN